MTNAQWLGIAAQIGGVLINVGTAYAYLRVKNEPGLALAFAAYAVACVGYMVSIIRGAA